LDFLSKLKIGLSLPDQLFADGRVERYLLAVRVNLLFPTQTPKCEQLDDGGAWKRTTRGGLRRRHEQDLAPASPYADSTSRHEHRLV
jgi:hypothetical protein